MAGANEIRVGVFERAGGWSAAGLGQAPGVHQGQYRFPLGRSVPDAAGEGFRHDPGGEVALRVEPGFADAPPGLLVTDLPDQPVHPHPQMGWCASVRVTADPLGGDLDGPGQPQKPHLKSPPKSPLDICVITCIQG
ncbi:MAG: hypothetical protein ACRDQZ_03815, partial [Mycobacteriales bacterium]